MHNKHNGQGKAVLSLDWGKIRDSIFKLFKIGLKIWFIFDLI